MTQHKVVNGDFWNGLCEKETRESADVEVSKQ